MKVEIKNEVQTPFKNILVVALWGSKNASLIFFYVLGSPSELHPKGEGGENISLEISSPFPRREIIYEPLHCLVNSTQINSHSVF